MISYGFELEISSPITPADSPHCKLGLEIASPPSKSRGQEKKKRRPRLHWKNSIITY